MTVYRTNLPCRPIHRDGHEICTAKDAAKVFADRYARRKFGRRGRCHTVRQDTWMEDGSIQHFEAFIGLPAEGGRNLWAQRIPDRDRRRVNPTASRTDLRSHEEEHMTPKDIREARHSLGLTLERLAEMLGYEGEQRRSQMHKMESGEKPLRPAQERLLRAYLDGYRPDDWPIVEAVVTRHRPTSR